MSSKSEDQCSSAQPVKIKHESQKQGKISYSRDFLLSLSELDICKKLPRGFDSSILSEFEDTSHSVPERQRIPGSFSFRRGEYGSSVPSRGDSSYHSRGGRWDIRSSGSNDRDSDSLSDKDSESGRRQPQRSQQNSEHDGLLGSGAFPRPSGYAAGTSAPKVQGPSHYPLNRSSEPYHPPRTYKAVPHSRRENTDSYNDETFGSAECSSQDRAEEEKRRRASFELMRKEQHKAFQEKQKQFPDKHKENLDPDIAALLEDSENHKMLLNNNGSEVSVVPPASQKDSKESSILTQTPASRPLVPPGFMSTILDKNLGTKSEISSPTSEVGNPGFEGGIFHAKGNPVVNGTHDNQEQEKLSSQHMDFSEKSYMAKNIYPPFIDENEMIMKSSSAIEVSDDLIGFVNSTHSTSNLSEAREEKDDKVKEFINQNMKEHKILNTASQDPSSSILEKLFGSSLGVNSNVSSSFTKNPDVKENDSWSPKSFQSSKFSHWFLEEDQKSVDDLSSGMGNPTDLLSLISGEKGGSQMQDEKVTEHEFASGYLTSTVPSATVTSSDSLYHYNKSDATSRVLTCEDLEQSMMLEINENSSGLQHSVPGWDVSNAKTERLKGGVDDSASQHLLSLLHKGASLKEKTPSPSVNIGSPDKFHFNERDEKVQNNEKTLTLETLFGTAFMKELHSVEAPVSAQRGSIGAFSSTLGHEGDALAVNHTQEPLSDKIEGHWLDFDEVKTEEENLINSEFSSTNVPIDITDKLAALNAVLRNERSMVPGLEGPPFRRGPYDPVDPEFIYQNLNTRTSSPQFHHPQMNQGRPLYHSLDPHHSHHSRMHSQIRLMGPDSIIHREPPSHHHFPGDMFRPPSFQHALPGQTRFESPIHHSVLQQMHARNNFPPPHLLQGLQRGAPLPPQPIDHIGGYVPELDPMQGFPLGQRQPTYGGGLGMSIPGPGVGGSNHPEALERLIEMELRANSRQMQHPMPGGQGSGTYGHEVDMGFRYR